ncbi:MAG: OB-fold domain-containing protein [Ktedonobacteraceae bacterium]
MAAEIPARTMDGDGDSRLYWEGIALGELRIQRCAACARSVFYPRSICPHCHSDRLSWIVASGRGTIYTYTVAHQAFGAFAVEAPFIIALVELEEGVRMMTRIVGAPRELVTIGAQVHVTFETSAEGITLPYFRLVE